MHDLAGECSEAIDILLADNPTAEIPPWLIAATIPTTGK